MVSSISASAERGALDVLVVGAGPAGSASAALLARAGWHVAAVDRAAFPRDKACSEYMSPETVRLLDQLGVVPALEAAGAAPLEGTVVTAARGNRLHGRFALAGPAPFRPTGLSVSRRVLDHLLLQAARASGVTVLERTAVEDLVYDRGAVAGAVVRRGDGSRGVLRARLTVGADGLRSIVARRLGGRRHGRPRRVAFVTHVDGVAGMSRSAELHVGRRAYVGLNPIGGGRTNVALVVGAELARTARSGAEAFLMDGLRRFPGVYERVAAGTRAGAVLATGPFAAWSGRVVADGAALVGDAADFFDPFTGEGIYSALRGGELLADHVAQLLDASSPSLGDDALREYDRARRREFGGKWIVERVIGAVVASPRLINRAARRLSRRKDLADLLIGVTGNFVPPREVIRLEYVWNVFIGGVP